MQEYNFKCMHDPRGKCRQGGGECIKENRLDWKGCDSCKWVGDCEV